ncbi:RING-type domain-containing protein [Fusarium falciforme]|uniref:RING-type domain-containing protein n=1 Tax=Fusarium falciforme TaxID=195108 RepID=UPI0022FFD8DD|nr:RING-type domain-containing protein [Fusarium falciforme]WAO88799.1 RING-type domain-containing protein [Fusarium falciforme]
MPRSTMSSANGPEHFWPNIKNAILQNPAGQPPSQRMEPQCPVCFESFDITTFHRPSGNAPICVVLFCGHAMCRGCLRQAEESGVGGEDKKCPCCRTALACSCGEASKTFTVPDAKTSPDTVFDAPLTKPEDPNGDVQPKCHRCTASGEWLNRIDNGDWPREAETIEPGAVRFFYGAVDSLESEGRPITPESVSSAFGSVTNDEYQMLTSRRNDFMSQRRSELESANPWFGGHREADGLDRYSSSSRHHERRREVNVDYRAPLDPPRARHIEFEERRRMHDRLPEERSLQDQLSGLTLGGESRFDAFGRPRRGDGRDRAQQRFDEPGFDEPRRRRDAGMGGMASYGDFGAGRETGRDAFSGTQYGRDTGNPYSGQRGRETDNPYSGQRGRDTGNGAPQARNTGSPYGGAPYGGDIGRDRRFPNTQREANPDPFSRTERGRETTRPQYQYGRETGEDGDINAKFENNPEAQDLFRESMERMRAYGNLTEEELSDPSYIAWRKREAVNETQLRALADRNRAYRGGDGPSERRRW